MSFSAIASIAGAVIPSLLGGSDDKGGGSGAFIERPPTHSEMLRDIAQAAPIGETGQQGTVQGSTESAAQLESRRKYRQLFLAALQRAERK